MLLYTWIWDVDLNARDKPGEAMLLPHRLAWGRTEGGWSLGRKGAVHESLCNKRPWQKKVRASGCRGHSHSVLHALATIPSQGGIERLPQFLYVIRKLEAGVTAGNQSDEQRGL